MRFKALMTDVWHDFAQERLDETPRGKHTFEQCVLIARYFDELSFCQ